MIWWNVGVKIVFSLYFYSCSRKKIFKEFLSNWIFFQSVKKIKWPDMYRSISGSVLFHCSLSILMIIPYFLDYYRFLLSWNQKMQIHQIFILQCFDYFKSLKFLMNFTTSLPVLKEQKKETIKETNKATRILNKTFNN